ncbi:MAG: hypothetical protein QJR14_00280 [Bacillota bacterium]|nr:hypothetical protein [Bacillota bacterium]
MQGSRAVARGRPQEGAGRAARSPRRRPAAREGRRSELRFLGGLALLWLLAVGVVVLHVQVSSAAYRLDQEASRLAALRQQEALLAAQAASLDSPQRVLSEARTKLGLVTPQASPIPLRPGRPAGAPPAPAGRQAVVRLPPPPQPSPERAAVQSWWGHAVRFAQALWALGR